MHWPTLRGVFEAIPWVASLALLAKLILAWRKLPNEVACHFGLSGEPNGWMSREGFGAVTVAACVVMGLVYSPVLGHGYEKVSATFLFGLDMALLIVVIGLWQAINFNLNGKRLNLWLMFSPMIVLAGVLLVQGILAGR